MAEVLISEIIVEERARKIYGWLDSLERSIEKLGVLQPIGITPDKRLIFGGRRLQACKNLGMTHIPARVIDIDATDPAALLRMEQDENNQRLDLAPSEKVEIARRIEEALSGRQGQRTDLQPVQNFAQVEPGTKSRDIAAKAVGMNRETYRQAKAVVDSGNREAVERMDKGEAVSRVYESVSKRPLPRTIKVVLYKNPTDDAEVLIAKGGADYCTKLGIALLKAAGHKVEL